MPRSVLTVAGISRTRELVEARPVELASFHREADGFVDTVSNQHFRTDRKIPFLSGSTD